MKPEQLLLILDEMDRSLQKRGTPGGKRKQVLTGQCRLLSKAQQRALVGNFIFNDMPRIKTVQYVKII